MTKRRKFTPEFKREAVALTHEPGVSCRQVALDIGVDPNVLTRWRREMKDARGQSFTGSGMPRDEELAQLKRELARVKKERDFLREAATFFAKESS